MVKVSRLSLEKTFENFDFKKLPLGVTQQAKVLSEEMFVDKCENILAFGRLGSGKTHLLWGICHELAGQGRRIWHPEVAEQQENCLSDEVVASTIINKDHL